MVLSTFFIFVSQFSFPFIFFFIRGHCVPYVVKLRFPLISFVFSPLWFHPPHSFVLLSFVSLYHFQILFLVLFIFSFISVSLFNLFGEEGEYLFQNVFFAIKLTFSLDFKTKYQDFHVNFKPNTNYSIPLKFLELVVVLAVNFKRYTLYNQMKTGHSFLTKERWVAYVCVCKESLLHSCSFDIMIKPFSLHKLCISILKEENSPWERS